MPWPSITDFTDAVQNPAVCFEDPELTAGQVDQHPIRGTPMVYSGNFASVYSMRCGNRKSAVRCFTREVTDQEERYGHLSSYLSSVLPPSLVEFEFHSRGIRVQGEWYPIVKMDWVEGQPLNKYVSNHLKSALELNRVTRRWRGAASDLLAREIAHNDLQHGNVMVLDGGAIRLVDYDGIFLPEFQGQSSPEIGHQNFQHPLRTGKDYAQYVDNFPALVIYVSLLALANDPGLWDRFNNGDNLILKKSDYADPANSQCFQSLKNSSDGQVRNLARLLEEFCQYPVDRVPDLESILSSVSAAPTPAPPTPTSAPPSTPTSSTTATGGGSAYRTLLQTGQAAPSAAPPAIRCPQCNQDNLDELIYCDAEECAAVLHPGSRFCAYCGVSGPVKASYCPDCGRKAA